MILSNPFNIVGVRPLSAAPSSPKLPPPVSDRPPMAAANLSPVETRVSLVFAVAAQAASASQRLLSELVAETAKYVFPKRFESRNLEEALMAVGAKEMANALCHTLQIRCKVTSPEGLIS